MASSFLPFHGTGIPANYSNIFCPTSGVQSNILNRTQITKGEFMSKIKVYIFKYFEQIVVLFILAAVVVLNYFIAEKLALLNLFYLPAIVVGHLHEKNEKQIVQLKSAYMGILEILSKYLESADKYTQGHSVRVSHYATEIAEAMTLEPHEIENIKVAALLHDIGKVDISTELIGKAASLSSEEMNIIASHSERGARILSSVSSVLSEAIPLVLAHHQYFDHDDHKGSLEGEVQLGAHILAVADSYDAMTTDRPYRSGMQPWKAIEELERGTGTQFNPEVVAYFKKMLFHRDGTHQILSGDQAPVFE